MTEAKRGARNWKLAIAVVDPHGDLVYFYKMDQTQFESTNIAIGKARTAARLRRPTEVFFNLMQTPAGSFVPTLTPDLIASPGGIPDPPGRERAGGRGHRLQRRLRRSGPRGLLGRGGNPEVGLG